MLQYARLATGAAAGRTRADLDRDPVLRAAMERFVEVIGEAASQVTPLLRSGMPDVPWADLVGMRNRLIHGYVNVDPDVLWSTVKNDLPALIVTIAARLAL